MPRKPKPPRDSATAYARSVVDGEVPACKWVRLACERHLRDIASGRWYWDVAAAEKAIAFLRLLRHYKGEYAGQQFEPLPWQCFMTGSLFGWKLKKGGLRRFRYAFVMVPRKNGKALDVDTPIATPSGWKRHGDLVEGDYVFAPTGKPIRVEAVTPHYSGPCMDVVLSDGERITAHERHEWMTDRTWFTGRGREKHHGAPMPPVETLRVAETLRSGSRGDFVHRIPVADPLSLPDAVLPIDPYTLGAWLGDGTTIRAHITCADREIIDRIQSNGTECHAICPAGLATTYRFGSGERTQASRDASPQALMRKVGLLGNKHIPAAYLRASHAQRMEVLRGLVDTDGHITARGQVEITLTNKRLVSDAVELITSLGMKPSVSTARATIDGRDCGEKYRIQFFPSSSEPLAYVKRKRDRQRILGTGKRRCMARTIVDVVQVGDRIVNCIQVEGGLYLAGRSMVSTHNSFIGAGVGLLMLAGDGEPAAEVYSVATKEDQAKLLWNDGRQMVRFSPGAADTFKRTVNEIRHEASASVWRPVGSDSETLDGLNPHGILADELHAWKSRALWDVLDSATGARTQPLFFQISTEGSVRDGIFDEQVVLSQAILSDQALADDAGANVFGLIFTIDDDDDPMAEASWFKANPNLGCGKSLEYMRDQAAKAALSPGKMRDFLTKQLNKRAEKSVGGWLSMERWDACAGEVLTQAQVLARLAGKSVFCGFDASRSQDLAAVALTWEEGEMICCAWLFFTPDETLREREISDRAPYSAWVRAGWMTATDGNIIDYRVIVEETTKLLKTAKAGAFWYDPSHGHEAAMQIRDEVGMNDELEREDGGKWTQVAALAQTWGNFSRPYREIERRVIGGTLRHFGNPVARWNVQNAVPHVGPSENIMLHKGRSRGRIDGAVALGMGFAARLTMPEKEESAYSKRGIITL